MAKRQRACCPVLQRLEERVALSLTLSGFVHSLLPFIKSKTSTHVVKPHIAVQGHRVAAPRVASLHVQVHPAVAATAPATGGVPVYGPYIGRPGTYRHKPPLVVTHH